MLTTTPCHDAFDAACAFRKEVPLPSGRYKLDEALWELRRMRSTIDLIAKGLRGKVKIHTGRPLGACCTDEKAIFLKSVPRHVADILGRKILPGIAALHGDGVPRAEVRRMAKQSEREGKVILAECERVHVTLKQGIRHEYAALRSGTSELPGLIDRVEKLAADGARLV
jgi:hypothetical protein